MIQANRLIKVTLNDKIMPHWRGQTLSLADIPLQLFLLPIFNFFILAEHPISISKC